MRRWLIITGCVFCASLGAHEEVCEGGIVLEEDDCQQYGTVIPKPDGFEINGRRYFNWTYPVYGRFGFPYPETSWPTRYDHYFYDYYVD